MKPLLIKFKKIKSCKYFIVGLLIFFLQPLAAINPVILDDETGKYELADKLEIFVDANKEFEFSDVVKEKFSDKFVLNEEGTTNFNFTSAAYWVRFQVINNAEHYNSWIIELDAPLMDKINLFIIDLDGKIIKKETGRMSSFSTRDIEHRNFAFPVKINEKDIRTFYFRFESEETFLIPLILWERDSFAEFDHAMQIGLGIFYGIMLAMIFYNIFLFIFIKDRGYLYYVLFIFFLTLHYQSEMGSAYEYLWSNLPQIFPFSSTSLSPFLAALTLFFGLLMFRNFLIFKTYYPHFDRHFIRYLVALSFILIFIAPAFKTSIYAITIIIITMFSSLLVIAMTVLIYFKGYSPARYLLFAFTVLLIAISATNLQGLGVLPSHFLLVYSPHIGLCMTTLLFSLALADRYNIIKRDKEAAQQELLDTRLRMLDSFSRFVPKQFLTYLERESIIDVALGDAVEKKMSVLFSDIRHFTTMSEKMDVEENFKFLNSYLSRMGPAVHNNNGFIDKFVGDAIMALFPDEPQDALRAAIEMREILEEYNSHRAKQGYEAIDIGIGVHTGDLMLGTVGSPNRLETTVIGDTVNLAARIESTTKIFKVPIILSDGVYDSLSNPDAFLIREIDTVRVRGKDNFVVLFEAFDNDKEELLEQKKLNLSVYNSALEHYKSGDFKTAEELFLRCLENAPSDRLLSIYINRCKKLQEHPPGPKWKGISKIRE
jgi:adenylate cyclase